jgi:AraC-like DNA-binding protein
MVTAMNSALIIPPALQASVASVQGLSSTYDGREVLLVRLPTCGSQLVVHVTPRGAVRTTVTGPNTLAKYRLIVPGPFYIQFILQPDAARAIFRVPACELTDRAVELEELWGPCAREVSERVGRLSHDPQAAAFALEDLLAKQIVSGAGDRGATLARRAIETLELAAPEAANIGRLARDLGASERSLRQAFHDHVGVSPKRYMRIARIRRVVARAGSERWARLAAEHGFYDQAHLNAEFRALLGVSPSQYLARQFPLVRRAA